MEIILDFVGFIGKYSTQMTQWELLMENILPEIVFSSSDKAVSARISRLIKAGKLRKIAPKIYSSNLTDATHDIIRRNLYHILSKLFPGAVLSHRSAFEGKPTEDGTLFLTFKYTKTINLPGITIRLIKGHRHLDTDLPFMESLFVSSESRTYLENMQAGRSRKTISKTLTQMEIEQRLDKICRIHGEEKLNSLRDNARIISTQLNMEREFDALNSTIGAILKTRSSQQLISPGAIARSRGEPYDPDRLELFQVLFAELRSAEIKSHHETNISAKSIKNMAFFESYFSNYIEGTEFEINTAHDIIENNIIPSTRPADAHDIIGTYNIVSNLDEMRKTPDSTEDLIQLLKARHSIIMSARPDKKPGFFKENSNRAGQTFFVEPEMVQGTLRKSFEIYQGIESPAARAFFMMFAVSEIHPFEDGNGRIARVMMNAELVKSNISKIIIPTVYRDDYLLALRALSRNKNAGPYIKMMSFAHRFTSLIDFSSYEKAVEMLKACNAFNDPEADMRLIMPPQ